MIKSLESFFLGIVLGACITLLVGFGYYGWRTNDKGLALSELESDKAVINSLAAICVERFTHDLQYNANLQKLKQVDKFSVGDFMEIGGWSKFSTSEHFELEISNICAKLILSQAQ
jgi:hypothetical protein